MLEPKQLKALRNIEAPEFGNRVAQAIRMTDKNQTEVAADLGMSPSQLSDLCRGRWPDPKLSTLQKLADYFGCLIEDLFPSKAA